MQITIRFTAEQPIVLPLANAELIQGLIYRALRTNERYSLHVHENGESFDGRKFKLFTFGELKGNYEVVDKDILYRDRIELEIRSVDAYTIQLLLVYFTTNKIVQIGNNDVTVDDVRLEDLHVHEDAMVIRTLSPITVYVTEEDGHTRYFTPQDEQFYTGIIANARRKWASHHDNDDGFALRIRPAENTRFIRRATRFKRTFITAWHGSFVLEGPSEVLDFLYQTGLGSKNSQGFGMFKLI